MNWKMSIGGSELWTCTGPGWATLVALAIVAVCVLLQSALPRILSVCGKSSAGAARRGDLNSNRSSPASRKLAQITEEELQRVLEMLEGGGREDEVPWEEVLEKQSNTVTYSAKLRDPKDGGATEYFSSTVFEDCSTQLVRDFYMDSDFRSQWDKTLVHHRQLDICRETGTEVGQMVKKFPLMKPREYVLAWRLWEGDDQSYYCLIKACEHENAPRQSKSKRVEVYLSGWHIRKVAGREACEIKVVHQEDGGMQREMAKLAFRRGIWSYVLKMDLHLRRYKLHPSHLCHGLNAVSLAHKLPAAIKERFPRLEAVLEDAWDISRQGSNSCQEFYKRHSKRQLAKGMLLVGGALFLTHSSASLGAKIVTACIVRQALKSQGSSPKCKRQGSES